MTAIPVRWKCVPLCGVLLCVGKVRMYLGIVDAEIELKLAFLCLAFWEYGFSSPGGSDSFLLGIKEEKHSAKA